MRASLHETMESPRKTRSHPMRHAIPVNVGHNAKHATSPMYTLDVFLLSGPMTDKFVKKNPVVSRGIQMRGDQTLLDLHRAIFGAFGRWEEHMFEFQFGKGPMDPNAPRYVLPSAFNEDIGEGNPPVGRVDQTTLES